MGLLVRGRYHVVLAVIGMAAYCNSPLGQYCYDDLSAIQNRKTIETWANLPKLASREYGPAFGELSYRPLVSLTYFIDAKVFGKTPFFSRWINLALHLAVGFMLFGLWNDLYGRPALSFLAAAIFLCHPVTTEAVDCSGFREEPLSTLLMIGSMRLALNGLLAPRGSAAWGRMLPAAALWLLALLAKESALMAAALAPMAFWASPAVRNALGPSDRAKRKRLALSLIGFALALAVYLCLYLAFSYRSLKAPWPGGGGPLLGFLNFCRAFPLYLRLWLIPTGLSVGHYFEASTSYGDWRLWAGAAVLALFAAGSAWAFARGYLAGAGGLWVCFGLLPVAQIIPTPEPLAERFLYMPHAGMALLMAAALVAAGDGLERCCPGRRWIWRAGVAALLAVCIALTFARNRDWHDDATLNIRRYEQWDNAQSRMALGALYHSQNQQEKAMEFYLQALDINPDLADAHRNLGLIYLQRGQPDLARPYIERANRLDPANEKNRLARQWLEKAGVSETPGGK